MIIFCVCLRSGRTALMLACVKVMTLTICLNWNKPNIKAILLRLHFAFCATHGQPSPYVLQSYVQGHWEVVAMLLGARADLNRRDNTGTTALDEACQHGHDRIIKLLTAKGARCVELSNRAWRR